LRKDWKGDGLTGVESGEDAMRRESPTASLPQAASARNGARLGGGREEAKKTQETSRLGAPFQPALLPGVKWGTLCRGSSSRPMPASGVPDFQLHPALRVLRGQSRIPLAPLSRATLDASGRDQAGLPATITCRPWVRREAMRSAGALASVTITSTSTKSHRKKVERRPNLV